MDRRHFISSSAAAATLATLRRYAGPAPATPPPTPVTVSDTTALAQRNEPALPIAAAIPAAPAMSTTAPPAGVAAVPVTSGEPATSTTGTAPSTTPIDPDMVPFRMPDELVTDIFELRPAGVRADVPILMDQPLPDGIVFKVQIGAFRKPVPGEVFSDMTPVMGETVGTGLVRYTAGLFTGFQQAAQAKDKVRSRGYNDAFVVAYRNGERIPLGEAMRSASAGALAAERTAPAPNAPATLSTAPVATVPSPRQEPAAPVVIAAPATAAPSTDPAVILANYPATAEEVLATFTPTPEATTYYNVPGAAPARQVETIMGLFFTVQVGVYSRPVPLDKLFNITPLNSERTETAKVRYTTGIYTDMASARDRREQAIALGVKDAFITAYLNGKRIPMREADALITKFGPAIMARP